MMPEDKSKKQCFEGEENYLFLLSICLFSREKSAFNRSIWNNATNKPITIPANNSMVKITAKGKEREVIPKFICTG